MEIKIYNPNKLPLIDYRKPIAIQKDLKDLTESNYTKLKNVLIKRGFKVPLFLWADGDRMCLLDGTQRQRVMVKEDMKPYEVPYLLIDAETEAEAKAQLLEISSQYGRITQEGFDSFVVDLPELDIQDINFDALQFVGQEPDVEEDEAPPVDDVQPAVSKLGEVYRLGRHRVMCGDSTDKASVELLMNGNKADMVFTDPPYGMSFSSGRQSEEVQRVKTWGVIKGDDLRGRELEKLLTDSLSNAIEHSASERPIYVCLSWRTYRENLNASDEVGLSLQNVIVWDKKSIGIGNRNYRPQHEFVFYFKEQDTQWFGGKGETDIWSSGRDALIHYDHPTQKPVYLSSRAISNSSKKDDIVLDLFGGSGSTLIACEQLDRICYMMELDNRYIDVIIKRWQNLTAQEAIRISDGKKWNEIAKENTTKNTTEKIKSE